jgi:peptidoglycan/LPS O-acetylase OafA/YrhL
MPHRDDIQGLRAVAVLLVVLAHAGVPFLRGGYIGVDVFFVLSGFLVTGILLSEAERNGRISLVGFYARRARRILPAAALTLAVTDIAASLLLNFVRARDAVGDGVWASFFLANFHFGQATDYFARDQPPSPFEHYWTLAVEEQFYVVWPAVVALLVVGVAALRARRRSVGAHTARRLLFAVIVAVTVASLGWSVHATSVDPAPAYFSTLTRVWELSLGAALAVAAPSMTKLDTHACAVLGWLGLAGIAAAAVAFSPETPFPGYAALLPAGAAMLLLAAGVSSHCPRLSVGRVLSLLPLRYLGDRSYAFYLWHWPVLVIAAQYAGHALSLAANLALLAGAFLLSVVTYRFFENPIRRSTRTGKLKALVSPATAAAALLVALLTLQLANGTAAEFEASAASVRPVALHEQAASPARVPKPLPAVVAAVRAAQRGAPIPAPLTPSVSNLRGDLYSFPDGCTPAWTETSSKRLCRMGATSSGKTLVVFGDSHAQMWMPPILRLAQPDGWVVVPFVKLGCIPDFWKAKGGTDQRGRCGDWVRWAKQQAAALRPQVTLVIGSWAATRPWKPPVRGVASLTAVMKRFSARVIILADAPHQRVNPTDCLLARDSTMKTCTTTATPADFRADNAIATAARKRGIGFVRTRGWFCTPASAKGRNELCPLVINQTITSTDRGHIGQTYASELAQPFRAAFLRALLS